MQFTGQKAEQPASTACNRLARKMAANMRNAICVRTQTSKVPTQDILLVSSLFCAQVGGMQGGGGSILFYGTVEEHENFSVK